MSRRAYHLSPPIDHTGTPNAVCPYCGYEDPNSWELGSDGETRCPDCGKMYLYSREVVATYTTEVLEGE